MTQIAFQDGKVVVYGDKVGTGQECCCDAGCAPCPDLQELCISVTLTDYDGNVYTADQDDVFWFGNIGSVAFGSYSIVFSCSVAGNSGGITVSAGWADFLPECDPNCTSGFGSDQIPCSSSASWYAATASGEIAFEAGEPCDCYPSLGSFSVTFSDPPC